jgi:hypothetical protein
MTPNIPEAIRGNDIGDAMDSLWLMPPHNAIIAIRPRSLATIRDDIVEARRDYDDALSDKHEDRANEAETRLTDLQDEFETLLSRSTGMTFEALMKMREGALLMNAETMPTVEDALDEIDREHALVNIIARAASDPNVDVDKLERLLAMQERVLAREAEQAFNAALLAAQDEIRPILTATRRTPAPIRPMPTLKRSAMRSTRSFAGTASRRRSALPIALWRGTIASPVACPTPEGIHRDYQADVPADTGHQGHHRTRPQRTASAPL